MLGSSLQMKYTVFPVYLQISTNSAGYPGSGGNTVQKCIYSISMCGTLCAISVQTVQMEQYCADEILVGFPCAPNWYVHGAHCTWCTLYMVYMEQYFEGEILHFQWISIKAPNQWTQSTWKSSVQTVAQCKLVRSSSNIGFPDQ